MNPTPATRLPCSLMASRGFRPRPNACYRFLGTTTGRCVVLLQLLTAVTTALLAKPLSADYHLTFSDEFNEFKREAWQTSDFWGMRNNPGDYQGQWFCDPGFVPPGSKLTPYNPFIAKGGFMAIRAQPTPPNTYSGGRPNAEGQPYVSGQLTSAHRFTQRYGYYELRVKLPPGKGLWSRFWLLTDDGIWPGEYDIFEVLGKEKPVTVHQTTHYRNAISKHGIDGRSYEGIVPDDGRFHTYGFLWEPETVTWFVDGVMTLRQDNRINTPMYALIDLAVGKDPGNLWPGSADETTPWPADMVLDYFRIYSNDLSLPSVRPGPGFNVTVPPKGISFRTPAKPAVLPEGWFAGDTGKPEIKGTSTWNPQTGEWMMKNSAFGGQRHFAGKNLFKDGGIIATVQSTTLINSNDASAGVILREDTSPNTREIALLHTTSNPNRSLTLQVRDQLHGDTRTLATLPDVTLPVTLLLMRSGDTIYAGYSKDAGTTWASLGDPQTLAFPDQVMAGIGLSGNQANSYRLFRSTFTNVTVGSGAHVLTSSSDSVATGGTLAFTPSLISQFTGAKIPTGAVQWSVAEGPGSIDIKGNYTAPALRGRGTATIRADFAGGFATRTVPITLPDAWSLPSLVHTPPGDAGFSAGTWTLIGGGKGISTDSNHDTFRILSTNVSGNHSLTVKVLTSIGTQAGIVIRNTPQENDVFAGARSKYAGLWLTPKGLEWAVRDSKATLEASSTSPRSPVWLRITRSGDPSNIFTAFFSTDGKSWTQLGQPKQVAIDDLARVGVIVASGNNDNTATATFSNLSVEQ